MKLYFVDFEQKTLLESVDIKPGQQVQIYDQSDGSLIREVYPRLFEDETISQEKFDSEVSKGNFPLLTEAKLICHNGRDMVVITVTGHRENQTSTVMIDTEVFDSLVCAYLDEVDGEIN